MTPDDITKESVEEATRMIKEVNPPHRSIEWLDQHHSYYHTVGNNKHFVEWGKVAHEHGYDWHESVETGWLSPEHFQAFLDWYARETPVKRP